VLNNKRDVRRSTTPHVRAGLLLGLKGNSLYKVVFPGLTRKPEWRKDVVVDERDEPDDMLERGAEDTLRPLWKRRSLPIERGEKGVQQPNIAQTELASNTAQDPTTGSTPELTPQPTSDPTLDLTSSPTHEQQGLRRSARSTKGNTTLFPLL
jgi:hypothetical protein